MSELEQLENSHFSSEEPTTLPEPMPVDENHVVEPTEKQASKEYVRKSIIEKIARFAELADSLEEPEDPKEIEELLTDIQAHAKWVYDYIDILEDNAEKLRDRARKLSDAAKTQENRAKTYKEYLKTALHNAGFESFPMGDFVLQLIEQKKYVAKDTPTEKDMISNTEYVDTKFAWANEPTVMDWVEMKDKITRTFEWKIDKIKSEIKAAQKKLDAKKSTKEEKDEAAEKIDKLSALVREETSYMLKTKVNKID